jgi:hypothetical protein
MATWPQRSAQFHDVKRVFTDIDADHGDGRADLLRHSALLGVGPLASFACWQGRRTAGHSISGRQTARFAVMHNN